MWLLISAGAALAAMGTTLAYLARHFEPYLRAQIVAELEARFHTRVELGSFHVQVREGQQAMWGVWAKGQGLRIWPPRQKAGGTAAEATMNATPLIQLDEFSFHVPLTYRETQTLRVPEIRLTGLKIVVPPKPKQDEKTGDDSATKEPAAAADHGSGTGFLRSVVVEKVVCKHAELLLETDKPGKLPLAFEIQEIQLAHLTAGRPMEFTAVLTNAKPKGLIRTEGSFGPWVVDDPGHSAVKGKYDFEKANLGEFNGISGTLSSTGTYDGTLRNIAVAGAANVPDFALTKFGTAMELDTDFTAHVDGTDGDTYLNQVEALLGKSKFQLQGKIVRVRVDVNKKLMPETGQTTPLGIIVGHVIDIKVDVPAGRVEDFLKLVSKNGTPQITGTVQARAVLEISPGKQPVPDRIKLDGQFTLNDARLTNPKFQGKVEDLSLRGQGHPGKVKDANPDSIAATMQSNFQMANGVIKLPNLQYNVPGAQINLAGMYALDGTLHFDGKARMQATVSQMVGGWKGLLLKPVDPFFKKDGAGTLVPIHVRGTRENPEFGVDLGRFGHTHPEKPH